LNQGGSVLIDGEAEAKADHLADEPQLLAQHLPGVPVGVGRRRDQTGWEANVIIITKADQSPETAGAMREHLQSINPRAVIATAGHEPVALHDPHAGAELPLSRASGAPVALLSSIGDPQGFADTVQALGAAVVEEAVFPDHHRYNDWELHEALGRAKAAGAKAVVTTEKDHVRLRAILATYGVPEVPLWVLKIRMRFIAGEPMLDARLAAVFRR
jgi:tetraacyldisaccharide 4'-kinase